MSDQNQWAAEPPTQPAPQFHPKSPPPPSPPGQRQDTPPAPPPPAQPPPAQQRPPEQWGQQAPAQQSPGQPGADQAWQNAPTQNWSPAQQAPSPQPPGAGGQLWSPQPYQQPFDQQPYQPYQQPQGAGGWAPPPEQLPQNGKPPRRRRRKMRRSFMALFTVIVLVVLLVIGDRVALAIAENEFASQAQKSGLPVKPSVDIAGFPFLTQLIAKDFKTVHISASNIPVSLPSGGTISITSVKATISGLHISGFSSSAHATADHINATVFVSFGSLLAASGIGDIAQVTVKQIAPDEVRLSASVGGILSTSEDAKIVQTGPRTISIKLISNGGDDGLGSLVGSVLGGSSSFSFNLPKGVPASLKITSLTLNGTGLDVSAAASNVALQQS